MGDVLYYAQIQSRIRRENLSRSRSIFPIDTSGLKYLTANRKDESIGSWVWLYALQATTRSRCECCHQHQKWRITDFGVGNQRYCPWRRCKTKAVWVQIYYRRGCRRWIGKPISMVTACDWCWVVHANRNWPLAFSVFWGDRFPLDRRSCVNIS